MFKRITLVALSLLAVLITGCQKDETLAVRLRSKYNTSAASSAFLTVKATDSWTLAVEFPAGVTPWLSVNATSGNGTRSDIIMRFTANESEDPRQATLVVSGKGGAIARAIVTQSGKTPEAVIGNYGFDVAPQDWLELPETLSEDGREVLIHAMDGSKYISYAKSGTRNWSCDWDYKEHLSLWVAYPLNTNLRGGGKRTDEWGYDKLLPEEIQPDIRTGSYGGGWTRGHQIPSADRLDYDANVSTFVPTNMTPQAYNFNGGIWAKLEEKVRSYAKLADTLYVVTGCLYKDSHGFTGTSTGFAVRVPTHYFKALLYSGSNSYAKATDGYLMAGWLLPHDDAIANGNCLDYRMSISQLEKETGIDFFPNLARRNPDLAKELELEEPNPKFWR